VERRQLIFGQIQLPAITTAIFTELTKRTQAGQKLGGRNITQGLGHKRHAIEGGELILLEIQEPSVRINSARHTQGCKIRIVACNGILRRGDSLSSDQRGWAAIVQSK